MLSFRYLAVPVFQLLKTAIFMQHFCFQETVGKTFDYGLCRISMNFKKLKYSLCSVPCQKPTLLFLKRHCIFLIFPNFQSKCCYDTDRNCSPCFHGLLSFSSPENLHPLDFNLFFFKPSHFSRCLFFCIPAEDSYIFFACALPQLSFPLIQPLFT